MTSKQYYLQRIANLEDMVGALVDESAAHKAEAETLKAELAALKKPKKKGG